MRNLLFIPIILVLASSCKKDKLVGDADILVGKWEWINTQKVTNYCAADTLWNYSYYDSAIENNSYSLEFLEKGKVKFYHNDGLIFNNRVVIGSTESIVSGSYDYRIVIYINNNENDVMDVYVGTDSLRLFDFPFDHDVSCEEYFNHFIRN
ncbi:MAG: hypothetical protein R2780_13835 [Crocinitomicaceae bacterium]